jgi:hypothetical protein
VRWRRAVVGSWPRLIVFAIPLRDPLPLAHESTFARVYDDSPVEELSDVQVRATADLPPYPEELQGRRTVSMRIWQLHRDESTEDYELARAAFQVLGHVSGQLGDESGPGDHPAPEGPDYRTVVEAVTVVLNPEDVQATDDKPDPLTRCIAALTDQVRAYRVADNVPIPELTYERIFPIVPYVWRELYTTDYFDGINIMLLEHSNVRVPSPEVMQENALEKYTQFLARLARRDPFFLYSERRLEAQNALNRDGEYAESAIQGAIASEVLLSGVLGMMLWEESLATANRGEAISALSLDIAKRVRTCYHDRLGSNWQLTGRGPVSSWYTITAGLRNRVVHRGYRPSKSEAQESLDALFGLEKFICDRLAACSERYPRTTLALLGRDGLDRRGAWSPELFSEAAIGDIQEAVGAYVGWREDVDEDVSLRRRTA